MKNFKTNNTYFLSNYVVLAFFSMTALVASFFAAVSGFGFEMKSTFFSAVIVTYFAAFCFLQKRQAEILPVEEEIPVAVTLFDAEVENRLLALEEASEFFGAALKFPDMFRLISSRINELIPFATCALVLVDEKTKNLKTVCSVGRNARELLNFETDFDKGLAGKTITARETRHEEKLLSDRSVLPEVALNGLISGLAVPLFQNGDTFGALALYADEEIEFGENSIRLIEAVAARVAPLFLSSLAFERSVSNALTDTLTNLPNERAFYLVLENQIAESARSRDTQPLTVLTIDIKNFTGLNQKFGHAAGDRILVYTAGVIKSQLRQMDFLARSNSDEFLAVLPTASEEITLEIIERIEKAFISNPCLTGAWEKKYLNFNFGAATFREDDETASRLLKRAYLRKKQTKSPQNNVILFPKEYVS